MLLGCEKRFSEILWQFIQNFTRLVLQTCINLAEITMDNVGG
jgi:hypothetical protein